jgi:hypothetical protein
VKLAFGPAVGTELADDKASDRPRVRGEDVGQCVQAFALPSAELVILDEVQGGGEPKEVPPPGEDSGPHTRFDGEEGYDGYQHLIGEAANEVHACRRLLWFWLNPPLLVGRLVLHRSRRRSSMTALIDKNGGVGGALKTVLRTFSRWPKPRPAINFARWQVKGLAS